MDVLAMITELVEYLAACEIHVAPPHYRPTSLDAARLQERLNAQLALVGSRCEVGRDAVGLTVVIQGPAATDPTS